MRVDPKQNKAKPLKKSHEGAAVVERNNERVASKGKDGLIWAGIILLLAISIVANSIYAEAVAMPVRIAGFIVLVIVLMAISLLTRQGKSAWGFIRAARGEMRRVVWPTRQETVQTTLLIIGVVLMAALIMWLFDSLFLYIVRLVIAI
ncbi:preprotein translocase subunit SecE [Thiotrichales bacterium 19S3-7]|nr:preprotein translocase subunit SecE [Thiotrichales bacterium 19S3-7]MCF6800576.1 preprotein translocase subunit SecE [Thiotrichales bacterium 19S3-11]